MRLSFILSLILISTETLAGNVSVNDAAAAAQTVERPNYGSIVTNDKRNDVVNKDFIGDTSDLSNLRPESGMGDLFTPGADKANGCLSKNDPECLAVQLVYQGGANKPELSDEEKDKILGDYQDTIENADSIIGEAGSIVSTETHCETVTTVIPGLSEIEVCDESSGGVITGSCSEGWTMEMGTRELYRCHTGNTVENKTCSIKRQVLSHTENRYSCVKAPAESQTSSCTVPVTVNVTKTYPYQCRIEQEPATKETCIKTLNIEVVPPCTTAQSQTVSLKPFNEVGYGGTASYLNATVSYACSNTMSMTVKFGSRPMATFTSAPATVKKTLRIEFVISVRQYTKEERDFYEVTITNTDKGKGTRTVTVTLPLLRPNHKEIERWETVCK